MIGEENTYLYRTSLYLAASASAEFFADIALSPMECCKVRIQTSPVGTFPTTLRKAAPKIYAEEGLNGFYKSLAPLWGRQIPYTMMKFACFERTVEAIYAYVVPKPRAECTKGEQLIVTFAAGYIAGGNLSVAIIWPQNVLQQIHIFFSLLRHCFPSCRHHCVIHEQVQGMHCWNGCQGAWLQRNVGRSWSQDYHDRYSDSLAMVHLRLCQGHFETSSSSSTRNARIFEEETWSRPTIKHLKYSLKELPSDRNDHCIVFIAFEL